MRQDIFNLQYFLGITFSPLIDRANIFVRSRWRRMAFRASPNVFPKEHYSMRFLTSLGYQDRITGVLEYLVYICFWFL